RVGEHGAELAAVLAGAGGERVGGAGGARDVGERAPAVGAHLPLDRGRRLAARRRGEGDRLGGVDRLVGGVRGHRRRGVHGQRGGGRPGVGCRVGEHGAVRVAVLAGGGGEGVGGAGGARDGGERAPPVRADLPLDRGSRGAGGGRGERHA